MIAVHALIIFSEIIGCELNISCASTTAESGAKFWYH